MMGKAFRVLVTPDFLPLREVVTDLVFKVSQLCDLALTSQAAFIGDSNSSIAFTVNLVKVNF